MWDTRKEPTQIHPSRRSKRLRQEAREHLSEMFLEHYNLKVRGALSDRLLDAAVLGKPRILGLTAVDHWAREHHTTLPVQLPGKQIIPCSARLFLEPEEITWTLYKSHKIAESEMSEEQSLSYIRQFDRYANMQAMPPIPSTKPTRQALSIEHYNKAI